MIATLLTAIFALAACGGKASEYNKLNEMLDASYSKIELTVTDTFGDLSLESKYTIRYSDSGITVGYTVEKFAEVTLDNPSTGLKTTLTGEAVIEDGVVVSVNGDDIGLGADIAKTGLTFKKEFFKKAELTDSRLKADVKDASGFLGTQLTCTDMKVEAAFGDVLYNINIVYTSEGGNEVKYAYVFTL